MDTIRSEDGLALATVLVMLVALTAIATGGFLVSTGELRVSDYHLAGSRAFHVADAAMEEHLGRHRRGDDAVNYTHANGSATVAGEMILEIGDGNTLHLMRSTSQHSPAGGGTAVRDIRLIAMLNDNEFRANAAITAGSGLHKNGSAGSIDGRDDATTGDCVAGTQPDVAGVATETGGYTQNGAGQVLHGTPDLDDSQSGFDQLSDLGIPWSGILNGTVLEPDFRIPPDTWPDFAGGQIDPDWWPVIYTDQPLLSVDSNHSGWGTIIAENDLTMTGSFTWKGIILIGGVMTSDGFQEVDGTTIAALNLLLGQPVGQSSVGNGAKTFTYNSCWVRLAAQQFVGGLIPMPGTWSERM